MMFLVEYFLGMFLAYFILSPRLRGFIGRSIVRLTTGKRHPPTVKQVRSEVVTKVRPKPIELGNKGGIEVEEDDIQEWLGKNPDLKEADGG